MSVVLVNHWIEELREIPHGFSQEWMTPTELESGAINPTIKWTMYRTEQLGEYVHIPLYPYSGSEKYRAITSALYAKN